MNVMNVFDCFGMFVDESIDVNISQVNQPDKI